MQTFIIVVVLMFVIDALGKLMLLAKNEMEPRRPVLMAFDVVLDIAVLMWAMWILNA